MKKKIKLQNRRDWHVTMVPIGVRVKSEERRAGTIINIIIQTARNLSLQVKIMIINLKLKLILPQIQFLYAMEYTPDYVLNKIDVFQI